MAGIGRSTRYIEKLKRIVKAEIPEDDPAHLEFIKDIARVELDVLALEATELRVVAQMARGIDPGPAASLFKIRGTEIFQDITELTHRAIGNYGLAIREHPASANHYMRGPSNCTSSGWTGYCIRQCRMNIRGPLLISLVSSSTCISSLI